MPCKPCDENQTRSPFSNLNTNLERAELNLTQASYSEIPQQHLPTVGLLIEAIRKIKNTQPQPLLTRLALLNNAARSIINEIQCAYCRTHTSFGINGEIEVAIEFEQAHYWEALKKSVSYDAKKYWWLTVAFYYRLWLPWVSKHPTVNSWRLQ